MVQMGVSRQKESPLPEMKLSQPQIRLPRYKNFSQITSESRRGPKSEPEAELEADLEASLFAVTCREKYCSTNMKAPRCDIECM